MTLQELVALRKTLAPHEYEALCKGIEAAGIVDGCSINTVLVQPYKGNECALCGAQKVKSQPYRVGEAMTYSCSRCGIMYSE